MYFFELPLLIFGLWKLLVSDKKIASFLVSWVLLAPLGSALTYDDVPNLQRTLIIFPALSVLIAYGFIQLTIYIRTVRFAKILQTSFMLVMIYSVLYYFHQYYLHQMNHQPLYRQEGYKELVSQLSKQHMSYEKVIVTDTESAPSIFFLFYTTYDPAKVQEQLRAHPTNVTGRMPLENYEFPQDSCPLREIQQVDSVTKLPALSGKKNVLYVNSGNCDKLDDRAKVVSEIKRSDNTVVFRLYEL